MNIKQILNWISKLNCGEAPVWSFPHANKGTSRQEEEQLLGLGVRIMMLDANFNNISAISWRLVLLVEETGVSGKKHRPVASDWPTLSRNVV